MAICNFCEQEMRNTDQLKQLLTDAFATLRMECAGRHDDPHRWSPSDLATDLAPLLAPALPSLPGAPPWPNIRQMVGTLERADPTGADCGYWIASVIEKWLPEPP